MLDAGCLAGLSAVKYKAHCELPDGNRFGVALRNIPPEAQGIALENTSIQDYLHLPH